MDGHPDLIVRINTGNLTQDLELKPEFKTPREAVAIDSPLGTRNFGQAIYDFNNGITVNYRQGGNATRPNNIMMPSPDAQHAHYENTLRQAAEMPVEAYKQLLLDANHLAEKGFSIDPKPTNLLIDAERGRFNLIDMKQRETPQNKMGAGFITIMITDNTYVNHYKGDNAEGIKQLRTQIEEKMALAAAELGIEYKKPMALPPPAIRKNSGNTTLESPQDIDNQNAAVPVVAGAASPPLDTPTTAVERYIEAQIELLQQNNPTLRDGSPLSRATIGEHRRDIREAAFNIPNDILENQYGAKAFPPLEVPVVTGESHEETLRRAEGLARDNGLNVHVVSADGKGKASIVTPDGVTLTEEVAIKRGMKVTSPTPADAGSDNKVSVATHSAPSVENRQVELPNGKGLTFNHSTHQPPPSNYVAVKVPLDGFVAMMQDEDAKTRPPKETLKERFLQPSDENTRYLSEQRERFGRIDKQVKSGQIDMPQVVFSDKQGTPEVGIIEGRRRLSVLQETGVKEIWVTVPPDQADALQHACIERSKTATPHTEVNRPAHRPIKSPSTPA